MNIEEKSVLHSNSEVSSSTNICGSLLSLSGNASPSNLLDKRTLPLLYVQSSSVSKITNSTTSNNNNSEPTNDSKVPFSVSKPSTLSANGPPKIVQVQSNQNIAYVGTLFKGKDIVPQKVLLTPVKGKDVSVARLIVPRPTYSCSSSVTGTKQICRSFVVSPCPQGAQSMTPKIAIKTGEGKIIQPNIIRQRGGESKVLSPTANVSGGLIFQGKTASVTPPGLTLLKPTATQNNEKPPGMKLLIVKDIDKKNFPESPELLPSSEHNQTADTSTDKVISPNNKLSSDDETNIEEVDSTLVKSSVSGRSEINDSEPTLNPEKPESEINCNNISRSTEQSVVGEKPKVSTSDEKVESSMPPPATPAEEQPPQQITPVNNTLNENSMASSLKEISSTAALSSLSSSGERARKRKGSLSSVASPSKVVILCDNYENLKLFPEAEEVDPFKVVDWDDHGIGKLPESHIKFTVNDFSMIELYDNEKLRDRSKQNNFRKSEHEDEIYCCLHCGCYGLLLEFFNENYCSIGCRNALIAEQHAIIGIKEEIETLDIKDKKKILVENVLPKKPISGNESSKSSGNSLAKNQKELESDNLDNKSCDKDQNTADYDDSSSTDADCPSKKSFDDTKKLKKIIKNCKTNRKIEKSIKHSPALDNLDNNKSRIKLRPRIPPKLNKTIILHSGDLIAQDLDMTPSNSEKDTPKKQSGFRWNNYLTETKSSAAWVKLFTNPYPSKPNRFKVGHKLEAIDPEHQSYFCLVTVVEVKGYRIKLHFDGYPEDYDFWVNADNPNLFPSGFCNSHKIPLHPPPGIPMKCFEWNSYLSRHNVRSAPPTCFANNISYSAQTNLFKVDMKLEAVDRKNTFLVCVATVAAVMENRILVHFDSWGDMYDYWVDISSPYIRPCGWCQKNNHELTPPNGIKPENFNWKKYLKDTKSIMAPEKAFTLRPPMEFKKDMKIEAVDKRAPHLIRVATIAEVLPYQVKVSFDGFPVHFSYWVDDDSPDIHPVGWCSRAAHPLQPPPTAECFTNSKCPVPGCIGQGYLQGTKYENHTEIKNCPYSTERLGKETALTDRLKWSNNRRRNIDSTSSRLDNSDEESEDESNSWSWLKTRQENRKCYKRIKEGDKTELALGDCGAGGGSEPEDVKPTTLSSSTPISNVHLQDSEESVVGDKEASSNTSIFDDNKDSDIKMEVDKPITTNTPDIIEMEGSPSVSINPLESINNIVKEEKIESDEDSLTSLSPQKNSTPPSLPLDVIPKEEECEEEPVIDEEDDLIESNAIHWTDLQVSKFAQPLITCKEDCFIKEKIDGEGFLMLNKSDLLDYLGLSDSDAERVFRKINMLKQKSI